MISVYNPPNCPVAELELNSLLKNIQSPLILAGDFNCHHTLWDPTCSRPDKGALNLLNFMDQQNLCVLNDGSPTLLGTPYRRESSVDLTICSPSLMSQSFWSVLNCTYGSDHFPILIKINDWDSHVPNFTPRRNLKKANWIKFARDVDSSISKLPKINSSIVSEYENFSSILNRAADNNIPLSKLPPKNRKPTVWWDDECEDLINQRRQVLQNYKNNMTPENFHIYLILDRRVKLKFKEKKKANWQNFCESISPNTNISDIWKKIKILKRNRTPSQKVSLTEDWIEEFSNSLCPS